MRSESQKNWAWTALLCLSKGKSATAKKRHESRAENARNAPMIHMNIETAVFMMKNILSSLSGNI
jgi:hypothetical protein